MEVSILYEGKRYKYCDVGNTKKWVDNRNIIVSAMLSVLLKKEAVESGIDLDVFSQKGSKKPERVRTKRARVKSRKRKGSVTGGINLSSLTKTKGEEDDTK
jgi:hypothetical protein